MQMAGRLSIYVKTGKEAGIHSGHDRNGIRNDDTSTHDNQENDDDEEENHAGGLLPAMGVDGGSTDLTAESHVDKGGECAGDVGEDTDGD